MAAQSTQRNQAFCVTASDWSPIPCQPTCKPTNKKSCVDWSISRDLLGAAICGELLKLSETNAERSTGVPLLSAAESNFSSVMLQNHVKIKRTISLISLENIITSYNAFLGP